MTTTQPETGAFKLSDNNWASKNTPLLAYAVRVLSVRTSNPDEQRRGRLLSILVLLSTALIVCLTAINLFELWTHRFALTDELTDLLIDFLSGLFMLGLAILNHRGHTRLAAVIFLITYLGSCLLFFDLKALDRILLICTVPTVAASFILSPRESFVFASLTWAGYTALFLSNSSSERYNYVSMLGLFLLAALAWLTATGLEQTLADARRLLAREQIIQDKLRGEVGERQRAEDALRQAMEALDRERRLLRTVIDNVPDQIFARDLDGRFMLNNRSDAQAMGVLDPELLLGKNDYDFSPPDLAARYQADNRQVMLTGQPLINREEPLPSAPGAEQRWGLTTKVPLHDSRGQVIGIVGIARDITDRKRMEETLRASELKFRSVIEQAHDGIALADEHGAIIEWNLAEEQITGLSRDQVVGRAFWDVQHELAVPEHQPPALMDELREKHQQVFKGQAAPWLNQLQEREIQRVDGERRIVEMLIYPIRIAEHFALGCVMRDITDRKRVEEALRQSEDRYRALVEASPDAITLTDLTGRFSMANRRAAEMHGFASADDMIGASAMDLIAPEERQRAGEDMRAVLETGCTRNAEYIFMRADGTSFPVEVGASTVTDAEGRPQAFMGVTRDITERKRVAQALEKRARQLGLLGEVGSQMASILELDKVLNTATHLVRQRFGYYHVAIFILNPQRQELTMTARAGELAEHFPFEGPLKLGQGLVGWVGQHGERLLANDVRTEPRYLNLHPSVIPTQSELSVPIRVGGETIGVLDIQSPQLNTFDDIDVAVMETLADQLAVAIENARLYEAVQRELADRKLTEAELKRRNKDLIALNMMATALSQVAGLEAVLKTALDTVLKITGAEAGTIQLCDMNLDQTAYSVRRGGEAESVDDSEAVKVRESAVTAVMQTGQPLILGGNVAIYRSRTQSEQEWLRPCAAILIQTKSRVIGVLVLEGEVVRRWNEPDVQLLVAIGHEIGTVIENTQLAANAAEVQVLREVDRLRSELIANVSHELRTPLGLIKLFSTALLAEGFTFDDATQRQFLTEIDQETDRLEKIVSNLLDVSRIQSGRLRLDKEAVEVGQLIKHVVKRKELQLTAHQLVLDIAASPLMAVLDSLRIEQVLRNLLENAAKYSPNGGTITVQARGDAHQILVCVRDQGIGIPAHEAEKVFDRFYRVDNELTRTVGGLGLGLSVSRGIVEAHGGRMWVESTPGVGSSFFVSLPVEEAGNSHGQA